MIANRRLQNSPTTAAAAEEASAELHRKQRNLNFSLCVEEMITFYFKFRLTW